MTYFLKKIRVINNTAPQIRAYAKFGLPQDNFETFQISGRFFRCEHQQVISLLESLLIVIGITRNT